MEKKLEYRIKHYRINPFMPQFKKGRPLLSALINRAQLEQMKRDYKHIMRISVPPHGGATICEIVDENKHVLAKGVALCSNSDIFSARVGRNIARNRAYKEFMRKYDEAIDVTNELVEKLAREVEK